MPKAIDRFWPRKLSNLVPGTFKCQCSRFDVVFVGRSFLSEPFAKLTCRKTSMAWVRDSVEPTP